jgi:drug/metabolite transporter (DMT)-like permease
MTPAQAARTKVIAAFGAIYIVWGSTYLAIKIAIETLPPFSLGAMRFLIAGSLLYVWARWRTKVRTRPVHWRHAFVLGTLMLGVGNGAVVWSQLRVPSGIAALIVAIVPLWVVLLDWLRPGGERPHGAVMIGVVVGLVGLALLVWHSCTGSGDFDPLAFAVLMVGSLTWSIATVFGRKAAVPGYPPLTSAMQLLSGGVCLAVVAIVAGEPARMNAAVFTGPAVAALSYLVVFGSIVAFSAYSWLMRVAPPARIATYAYVNPVVAILLGWAFADEKLTVRTLGAAAVILVGVALITTGMSGGPGSTIHEAE